MQLIEVEFLDVIQRSASLGGVCHPMLSYGRWSAGGVQLSLWPQCLVSHMILFFQMLNTGYQGARLILASSSRSFFFPFIFLLRTKMKMAYFELCLQCIQSSVVDLFNEGNLGFVEKYRIADGIHEAMGKRVIKPMRVQLVEVGFLDVGK